MPGVIVERDLEWLAWLGRWRGATAQQVAAWFVPDLAAGTKVVERRMRVWRELGLVRSERVLVEVPAVHHLTRQGAALVGVGGPERAPVLGTLRHDLAVIDCATWVHRQRGNRMLTEREVRAIDPASARSPRFALLVGPEAGRRISYSDFITVSNDKRGFAHEVEASPKEHRRLVALMMGYARAKHITAVRYYARDAFRHRVEKAAEAANDQAARLFAAPQSVFVTGWDWLPEVAAGEARDQGRDEEQEVPA